MSASQSSSVVVPTGYKFRPTDEELVRDYLYNKVNGIPFKWVDLVPEYEGYGTKEPCQIWEEFGGLNSNNGSEESQLCFFTKGSCFKQTIDEEGCCWKSDGSEEWIKDVVDSVTNVRIGVRKTYYYKNDESEDNNKWIMHELSLDDSLVLQQPMVMHTSLYVVFCFCCWNYILNSIAYNSFKNTFLKILIYRV